MLRQSRVQRVSDRWTGRPVNAGIVNRSTGPPWRGDDADLRARTERPTCKDEESGAYFTTVEKMLLRGLAVVDVAWEGREMPAEESVLVWGKGITAIEIRKAAPLMAATANCATGLTGSMAVASLVLKSTPSERS
ncbi:hypothetical protein [Synechococcus sp. CCY 9618]|uniref:hypothetical protein n=1 Tax=Synechococcus sp. CCY 9618 TaxID=2815602 RepID=UPI001C22361E|nr:hypothetical protein [Synechococcus sp. CCY 9618]